MLSMALLSFLAFTAGFVDAVAGGGGLIQLPAIIILQPQMTLVQMLATNKTASFSGTSVAAVRYIKRVQIEWKQLSPVIISALVASFAGALLVSYVRKEQFMPVIIIALVFVVAYTILKRELGLKHEVKELPKVRHLVYGIGTGSILGLYEGLIGPGTGSFLLFAFITLFGYDFLHASAHAKIINVAANIGALSFFITKGFVVWSVALPVAACNMIGNYVGAHVAINKGSVFVKLVFTLVAMILIVKLCYDYL